jgi:hypothetical protein
LGISTLLLELNDSRRGGLVDRELFERRLDKLEHYAAAISRAANEEN